MLHKSDTVEPDFIDIFVGADHPCTLVGFPKASCDYEEQNYILYMYPNIELRGPSPIRLYPAFKYDGHPFESDYNLHDKSESKSPLSFPIRSYSNYYTIHYILTNYFTSSIIVLQSASPVLRIPQIARQNAGASQCVCFSSLILILLDIIMPRLDLLGYLVLLRHEIEMSACASMSIGVRLAIVNLYL